MTALFGHAVVEPVWDREELLLAAPDMTRVPASRMEFDPCGHYARPDVLELRGTNEENGATPFGFGSVFCRRARRQRSPDGGRLGSMGNTLSFSPPSHRARSTSDSSA